MLDLDHNLWRKPTKETHDQIRIKVDKLKRQWKPFDWTERVKSAIKDDGDDAK